MLKFVIKMTDWKEYLSSLYFNPKLPSSYLGPEKLYQFVKSQGRFKMAARSRVLFSDQGCQTQIHSVSCRGSRFGQSMGCRSHGHG